MRENNILSFPITSASKNELSERVIVDGLHPQQLDLFTGAYEKIASIVFVTLDNIDQNVLLGVLAKNSIKTIIDLRGRPVFPKPHFDHKFIMSYFHHRSMNYIEAVMLRLNSFEPKPLGRVGGLDQFEQWFSDERISGMTACIVDSSAVERGVVAAFRNSVADRRGRLVEIHPRSLT